MNDILFSSPLWTLFLFSLLPITWKVLRKNQEPSALAITLITVLSGIVSIGLLFYLYFLDSNSLSEKTVPLFSEHLLFDFITWWGSFFILLTFLCVTLMNLFHPQVDKTKLSEILFLQQGSLLGLLLLLWSNNLLTAFIGLELASLCFYMLIAMGKMGPKALIAAFKYFVLGSAAAAFFLYGISFVFGATGQFNLQFILEHSPELFTKSRLLLLGLVLIIAGILFKVSIFPFHFWLPDVYKNSFTPLLVLMAVGVKITLFCLLLKWTHNFFLKTNLALLFSTLQWLAVLSVLFGNIIALMQKDFKRMLLFSTVAHSGYLLMLTLAGQMGFSMVTNGLLYYLMIYAIMTIGLFICIYSFERKGSSDVDSEQLKGLAYKQPLLAVFITLFLLSLAGIPPTGGFIAKLFVFQSLIEQGLWWMIFWTILGSSVALYYYLKPLALMYMEQPDQDSQLDQTQKPKMPVVFLSLASCLSLLIVLSGLFPDLFQVM